MNANPRTDRLSLVIPAYNEAAVIAQAVREAEVALAATFAEFEIIVVDDGSSDETAITLERLRMNADRVRLLGHETNRGYGAALRTGFEASRFDLVAFTDADCQFDLIDLGTLAPLAAEFAIVAGYRVDRKDPWTRRFFSWGYNRLARTMLGTRVRDVDCALKVFQRDALAQLLPESRGFFVNTEMMTRARQLGLAITERPVTHRPRESGTSKVSMREIPRTAAKLVRFWWSQVVMGTQISPAPGQVFHARLPKAPRTATPRPASRSRPAA